MNTLTLKDKNITVENNQVIFDQTLLAVLEFLYSLNNVSIGVKPLQLIFELSKCNINEKLYRLGKDRLVQKIGLRPYAYKITDRGRLYVDVMRIKKMHYLRAKDRNLLLGKLSDEKV